MGAPKTLLIQWFLPRGAPKPYKHNGFGPKGTRNVINKMVLGQRNPKSVTNVMGSKRSADHDIHTYLIIYIDSQYIAIDIIKLQVFCTSNAIWCIPS